MRRNVIVAVLLVATVLIGVRNAVAGQAPRRMVPRSLLSTGSVTETVFEYCFRVNQTCLLSGVAAMLGQNGLACGTLPTIL